MIGDRRGVSNVLGFVLMFSLVVTTFAIYQADVIPHQNSEEEFEYANEMEMEMGNLKEVVDGVAASGLSSTITVPGGPSYPKRAIGINAPSPSGHLTTTDRYEVRLEGFNATGKYWNGSPRTFETRLLTFDPTYNYYEGNESYYLANGVVVKRVPRSSTTPWQQGQVVSGNTFDVVLLGGEIDRSSRSLTIPFRPVSTSGEMRSATVDGSATVRLPTVRSQADWDAVADRNANVTGASVTDQPGPVDYVEITLTGGEYKFRISNVTLDQSRTPPAAYVTMDPITGVTPANGQTFVVTTRDRFGNAVGNERVDLSVNNGGQLTARAVTTGDDGRATFGVTDANIGVTTVTATIRGGDPPAYEEFQVVVGGDGAATDSSTFPVYTSGQYFDGLGGVKSLGLSEGLMVPSSDSNCLLVGDLGGLLGSLLGSLNCGEVSFQSIQGKLALDTNSGTFTVSYAVIDWNEDGDVKDDDTGPSTSCTLGFCSDNMDDGVFVEIRDPDDDLKFQGKLADSAAQDVLAGNGRTDVMETSNYASVDSDHDSIPSMSSTEDIFVEEATGRVTVSVSDD